MSSARGGTKRSGDEKRRGKVRRAGSGGVHGGVGEVRPEEPEELEFEDPFEDEYPSDEAGDESGDEEEDEDAGLVELGVANAIAAARGEPPLVVPGSTSAGASGSAAGAAAAGAAAAGAAAAGAGAGMGGGASGGAGMDCEDAEEAAVPARVWRPGVDRLGDGEVLEVNNEAYVMYHNLKSEWPCLSFDILPDKLGAERTAFPATVFMVAGTQADKPSNNKVMVMKVSDLHRTQHDDDSSADDSDVDDDPVVETKSVPHRGGINRIRHMPQAPFIVSTWAETGKVHLYNVSSQLSLLENGHPGEGGSAAPIQTFKGHPTEGFAMDWSRVAPGRLVTGDCAKHIYLWDAATGSAVASAGGWNINKTPYSGHTDSVEDLQWSPNEAKVFASCSVDKTIKIWDSSRFSAPMLSVKAHETDVNVISWNPIIPFLVVSGADDGSFKVWDLRKFEADKPLALFNWHSGPITSVEWNPLDENEIVVASADSTVTVWDMSVEEDRDVAKTSGAAAAADGLGTLPAQLLFIHQGQSDVKEAHFHRQIPGLVVTTALDGFNFFKPDTDVHDDDGGAAGADGAGL